MKPLRFKDFKGDCVNNLCRKVRCVERQTLLYQPSPMLMTFSSFAMGAISIFLVHSILPHHWLPFVLVGREQKWSLQKTLGTLGLGAFVHCLSSVSIGLLVSYMGSQIDHHFHSLHGILPGTILLAFGCGFLVSDWHHRHRNLTNKMATWSLILMLGLSPCFVITPLFMIAGPLPMNQILLVCVLMSVLSIVSMMLLGWLVFRGLDYFKLEWLERNESKVMGTMLVALGLFCIIH